MATWPRYKPALVPYTSRPWAQRKFMRVSKPPIPWAVHAWKWVCPKCNDMIDARGALVHECFLDPYTKCVSCSHVIHGAKCGGYILEGTYRRLCICHSTAHGVWGVPI